MIIVIISNIIFLLLGYCLGNMKAVKLEAQKLNKKIKPPRGEVLIPQTPKSEMEDAEDIAHKRAKGNKND